VLHNYLVVTFLLYTQGYADDIVILILGKYANVVSELMQRALKIVESWCIQEKLSVNPDKTALVPFTKRRKLEGLKSPTFFGTQLQQTGEVKYLGLILDSKLTWNPHLQKIINKGKMALMATKRAIGRTWGLNPRIVHWLYKAVVRPMITYGSLVWWPKLEQRTAELELTKLQRLACLCITGAMRSTPTAALETLLNLPSLTIYIKAEARMAAYRLQITGNWRPGPVDGHSRITSVVTNSLFDMSSDLMLPKINTEKPFETQLNWGEVNRTHSRENSITWYTDGSKTVNGTGAGIHGTHPEHSISLSLGVYATVFQAEIHAIEVCLRENLRRGYRGKNICIYSDSQAAIKALACHQINSKLVWNCLECLLKLATHNKVTLAWVPGHHDIQGNEKADALAKLGSTTTFTGPEPVFGVTKTQIRGCLNSWIVRQHQNHWNRVSGLRHSKSMMTSPSKALTAEILKLTRNQIRTMTGLITGHCTLRKHLHTMGIYKDEPVCRLCDEEEETASHIIYECVALENWRTNYLEDMDPREAHLKKNLIRGLTHMLRVSNLF
jgi:ribonuclease HI